MKYHAILASAITSLCFFTTTTVLASGSANKPIGKQDRWFEIEVILFKHKGVKNQSKESFVASDLTAKKRYAIDLLTPYLQPDIASLIQLLPTCGQASDLYPFNISSTPISIWPDEVADSTADGTANNTDNSTADNDTTDNADDSVITDDAIANDLVSKNQQDNQNDI
jgi:hypothetical protein